ncbi:hypothetical protein [Formosa haliotis]|uniref:hypothetical protein n=1 Tax=Formosa haliotis TaxID=1555194 RepID=UPI001C3F8C6E|nr:hypothetical protein [Formosa haliotis]
MTKWIVIFFCFTGSLGALYAQTLDIPTSLLDNITKPAINYPQETVYLQTSKDIYETGEDVWFKGYLLRSQNLTPSDLSNTLYVQLVEAETNLAVWQEKYHIDQGFVDGHVFIQDTLKPGHYRLEALTSHSFYNNQQGFKSFRKLIIVDRISDLANDSSSKPKQTDFDFKLFPEGGYLVSGIQSTVAFKAIEANGQPKAVSGILFENDNPLLDFKTTHAGMGAFVFTPDRTKTYRIALNDSLSQTHVGLPEIKAEGKVLQLITNSNDAITLKVSKSTNARKEMVYVRVQVRGVVYTIAKTLLEDTQIVNIPVKDIPKGIAEITLFNQDLQPVAERLVFIKQDQKLHIKAILDKSEYDTKAQAKLNIQVTDQNGNPQIAHLGLSVYDAIYKNPKDTKTIETHFLLTEELQGNLYNPGYYFNDHNKNRRQALNLLLLTQGWRAYVWGEHNLKQLGTKKQFAVNDTIIGRISAKRQKDKALLSQQYVMAFTADKDSGKHLIEVDTLGRFIVLPEYIKQAQGGYLYLKLLLNHPNKNIGIAINDPTFKNINTIKKRKDCIYPFDYETNSINIKALEDFTSYKDVNQLDEVMLTAKKERVFRDKYMGTLDSLAKLDMNTDFICAHPHHALNCWQCGRKDSTRPIDGEIYNVFHSRYESQLDEHWINDGYYGFHKMKYKYPVLTEAELLRKFNLAVIKGIYPQKVFYEPVYDLEEQINGFPDYRNTLYWNSNIITDTNGQAQITFYCSDINTKFLGVLEGVSGLGQLGRQEFEFVVKR